MEIMETSVFIAVLAAAALHACWNLMLKTHSDRFLSTTLLSLGSGIVALGFMPFIEPPPLTSWIWLLISTIVHLFYLLALAKAYDSGDFGQIYPLARGTAPLLVSIFGLLFLQETMSLSVTIGLVLLLSGIWVLGLFGGRVTRIPEKKAIKAALLTAIIIAVYTIVDGVGARKTGSAVTHAVYLFFLIGLSMAGLACWRRGFGWITASETRWREGFFAGFAQFTSYATCLWAMTQAPLGLVASMRETSILFALLFAILLLGETLSLVRLFSSCLILAGLMVIRLIG